MLPSPWVAVVLMLAALRATRLTGWDDLPPVARLRAWAVGETFYRNETESRDVIYRYRRPLLNHFLHCAYCAGFWWSLLTYVVWLAAGSPGAVSSESWLFYVLVPLALSAAVGLTAKQLDP